MSKTVEAVYENGVLRPLESLNLREHQRVTVIVSESQAPASKEEGLEVECLQLYAAEADYSISLEAVREVLSKIPGSLTTDFIAEREEAWMADYFLDSSAVGKYYHTEVGTAEVDRLLKQGCCKVGGIEFGVRRHRRRFRF